MRYVGDGYSFRVGRKKYLDQASGNEYYLLDMIKSGKRKQLYVCVENGLTWQRLHNAMENLNTLKATYGGIIYGL